MTTIFQDLFNGAAGTIAGKTPDVGYGSLTWVAAGGGVPYDALLDGSGVLVADTTGGRTTADPSTAAYGDISTDYSLPGTFTVAFTVATGPSTAPNTDGHNGCAVMVYVGGGYITATLSAAPSAAWTLSLSDGTTTVDVPGLTVSPSTTYTGVMTVTDGAQHLEMLSQTLDLTYAYTTGVGLNEIDVLVGSSMGLDEITITDATPPDYATVLLTGPMGTLVASVSVIAGLNAQMALTAPMGTLVFASHDRAQSGDGMYAPMGTLTASTGARLAASAPMGMLSAAATAFIQAKFDGIAPMGTLVASAVVTQTASARLTAPMGTFIARTGARAAATAPMGTLGATSTTGIIARVLASAPMGTLLAAANEQNHAQFFGVAPMLRPVTIARVYATAPMGTLVAHAYSVVEVTYEAYAVNLINSPDKSLDFDCNPVTHFTNFAFDRIIRFKDKYYGVRSTGLFLLEGETDYAVPPANIPWDWKTCVTDFGTPNKKTLAAAYFGGRLGHSEKVMLYVGEDGTKTYRYTTPRDSSAQNYRQKFGLGNRDRYYAIGALGVKTFKLDTVDFEVGTTTRRI